MLLMCVICGMRTADIWNWTGPSPPVALVAAKKVPPSPREGLTHYLAQL